jgi:DHA1 family inner membrane transport protein
MAAFATAPGLQSRVLDAAPDAPEFASTLNIAAFNLGNAAAAWLGVEALRHGARIEGLPLLSAGLAVGALAVLGLLRGHAARNCTRDAQCVPVLPIGPAGQSGARDDVL